MPEPKIKVLYIAGFERSGSTILNRVLGQIDGFVAWGELRDIWQHGAIENRRCSCGALFDECPAWTAIVETAFGAMEQSEIRGMVELLQKTRASVLPHYFGLSRQPFANQTTKKYLANLTRLYQAIQATTKSRVIVDSTKASWYGYALSMLPTLELYIVHIVRDPRGVCYSLQRRKNKGEPFSQWYNPVHASLSWSLKNYASEMLLNRFPERYLRISYEEFIRQPKPVIESILALLDEEVAELPFQNDSTVNMGTDHIFAGSPSIRSKTGAVELNLDERWKQQMKPMDKTAVKSLTLPLLARYGYLTKT